ncbi:MAG: AI-2E family transporter [Thermodesulfobacteriota bacterium]
MSATAINRTTLLCCVALISFVFLAMIKQFLMAVFLAGLFSALATPFYRYMLTKVGGKENIASMLTVVSIIFLVLIPLSGLLTVVVTQAISVGQSVTPWVQTFTKEPTILTDYLTKIPYYEEILPYRDTIIEKLGLLVAAVSAFLIDSLTSMTKMTVNAGFTAIIMLYTMFYFLVDGQKLLHKILYYLPLEDQIERQLLDRFTSVAKATIKGTVIIGIIQGGLCGTGFALAGIPSPVFWGTLMAVLSIVPAMGTAIIWGPALIILLLGQHWMDAIILGVVCGLIAGNIDNLIRPRLVGRDTEMHDLFILFSTLGGIGMFGIIGITLGPILAALFVSIWEIYGECFKDYLPAVHIDKEPLEVKDDKEG